MCKNFVLNIYNFMWYQGNVFFVKIFETSLLYVLISEKCLLLNLIICQLSLK